MGRQVLLHLIGADELALIEAALGIDGVRLIPFDSTASEFVPVRALPPDGTTRFPLHWCFEFAGLGRPLVSRHVADGPYFTVDEDRSNVIEWSRSRLEGTMLKPGRIWACFEVPGPGGTQVDKGPAFRSGYEALTHWIRKNFERTKSRFYAGPEAIRFAENGGELDWLQ